MRLEKIDVWHYAGIDRADVTVRLDDGATAVITILREGDAAPVVDEVRVKRARGGSVDALTMRGVKLAEARRLAGQEINRQLRAGGTVARILAAQGRRLGVPVAERIGDYRPGRGGREDLVYARAVARYIELVEEERVSNPTHTLGQELAPEGADPFQWGRYALRQAKERKLYEPHGRGKAGGKPTAKAIELLRQETDA